MAEFDKESCTSDGTSSVFDEEKVQKLFQACDTNEDGYIDSNDLLAVCRDLNLEYSLDDLLNDLGADEHGRISYDEFLKRRLALKPEIEALQHSRRPHDSHEYLFPSSSTSLEGASGGKEKWEFDSGARDLSPEPNALQRLVEAAGGSVTTGNAANLLSLANKLHLAALASLRRDINSLTKELKAVTEQRDELLCKLTQNQRFVNENLIDQYEERITELHSVIAELNRKVEKQSSLVIEEEVLSEVESNIDEASDTNFPLITEESGINLQVNETNEGDAIRQELLALQLSKNKLEKQLSSSESELKTTKNIIKSFREKLREISENKFDPTKLVEKLKQYPLSSSCMLSPKDGLELELISRKIEHLEAEINILQLSLQDSKENNERLILLLSKYESNLTAFMLALGSTEQAIKTYQQLDSLMCSYVCASKSQEELELRERIKLLTAEKERYCSILVELESYVETTHNSTDMRNFPPIDLETAVLVEELMQERESNLEMRGRIAVLEEERDELKLQFKSVETERDKLLTTINNMPPQGNSSNYKWHSDERILREQLSLSLERQSKLTLQIKDANTALLQSLEKHKSKSQAKIHRMETQMLEMVENHAAQVKVLKQKIYFLEDRLSKCKLHCPDIDLCE